MTAYVTLPEFKAYLRNELAAADDVDLLEALNSASEAIDGYCGRSFVVASGSSARVYVPTETTALFIDDCTAVSSVVVDGTTLSSSDYQKEPLNGIVNGQSVPYTRLRRVGSLWYVTFPGQATVSVTGTWGWSATPSRVLTACKILAKEIAETRNQVGGYVALGDMAARAITHPKYRQMLDRLRRMDRVGGL